VEAAARDAAIVVSLALQYGVPLETLQNDGAINHNDPDVLAQARGEAAVRGIRPRGAGMSKIDLEIIKARVALPNLIVTSVKLRRDGNKFVGLCPFHQERTPSFYVFADHFHCFGCGAHGDALTWLMNQRGIAFLAAVAELHRLADQPPQPRPWKDGHENEPGRIQAALRWWCEAGPIEGTIGMTYFEREREIFELPPDVHSVLRFHGRCVWGQDAAGRWIFHPCIVALLRDVLTDEPSGVHRIALDPDGKLIGRMALGRKRSAAIKLWGDDVVTIGLVAGEGLETVLAAATRIHHRGTLLRPAWSVVDASNLENLPIIPGIEHLTILADADENNRGQLAARFCAKRWAEAGREVAVFIPHKVGDDFNDIARGQRRWATS
jgi:hypothetical protein